MIKTARALILEQPIILQLLRFGIIGGSATATQFVTVVIMVSFLQTNPLVANVLGYGLGFCISYLGHRNWTFAGTEQETKKTLPRFFTVVAFGLLANEAVYYILLHDLHMVYWLALIIVLGSIAVLTFILSKLWVFKA